MAMSATRKWTPEKDEILAYWWPKKGSQWDGWEDVLGFKTTPNGIRQRANIVCPYTRPTGPKPWLDEDVDKLIEAIKQVSGYFGRSPLAIARKIECLYKQGRL